ncbi:sigma-70 family RNA polymerase sigma factor [Maribellus comscasis]|uniref:Sigma-70 family RNA polymerase sigma factor n=1 Tax=Maribellus comscasis TaxID=2681766 RepID=A0A6I6JIU5_9BACT|nr:RNA polymerase sigma factor [Maribellus comscasis]QGY42785.1 sigma-70 family RNA polymerase sigma factor [Maribellus comscasis]
MQQNLKIDRIWKSFKSGDSEAFAYLYNLHIDSLYRYGIKLCNDEGLVKDSIQEVYLDLYLKKENNKTNPQNLKFYLILSLKHSLIKKLKRRRRFVIGDDNEEPLSFEPEYSIEKEIIEREKDEELTKKIKHILQELPSKQKEALYLRFNESMEYIEIARILNISIESSRKLVYRALKTVREVMEKEALFFFFFLQSYIPHSSFQKKVT